MARRISKPRMTEAAHAQDARKGCAEQNRGNLSAPQQGRAQEEATGQDTGDQAIHRRLEVAVIHADLEATGP